MANPNKGLEGLLNTQASQKRGGQAQATPQGGPAVAAPAPGGSGSGGSGPSGGSQGVTPASESDIARLGLPPGTVEIIVSQDDPAFREVASQVSAEGGQIVNVGGKVFGVPPQQQTPQQQQQSQQPVPGLLAGGPQSPSPRG